MELTAEELWDKYKEREHEVDAAHWYSRWFQQSCREGSDPSKLSNRRIRNNDIHKGPDQASWSKCYFCGRNLVYIPINMPSEKLCALGNNQLSCGHCIYTLELPRWTPPSERDGNRDIDRERARSLFLQGEWEGPDTLNRLAIRGIHQIATQNGHAGCTCGWTSRVVSKNPYRSWQEHTRIRVVGR